MNLIAQMREIEADFQERYAMIPSEVVVGSLVWKEITKQFPRIEKWMNVTISGLPIRLDPMIPLDAFDVYLTEGQCRRYYLNVRVAC